MSVTAQQVYDITMSLIDERLDTGLVDTTSTAIFLKNAPYILTSLQDELIQDSDYYKTHTITKSAETDNEGDYQEYDMPSDFQVESQIIDIKTDGLYQATTDFKWEGKGKLLIPDAYIGVVKVIYSPIPDAITALTDTMVLNDITCRTTLANGLASRLLTNENKVLANYFNDLYMELKNKPKRNKLSSIETIKDVYDSKMTY